MKIEMVMPQMGESITEGTILRWLKGEGDTVERDENILEISTDKVDSEIPAPARGRIVALLAQEGETVPVGQVIARIETDVVAAGTGAPVPEPSRETRQPVPDVPQVQTRLLSVAAPAREKAMAPGPVAPEPGVAEPAREAAGFPVAEPAREAAGTQAGGEAPHLAGQREVEGRFLSPAVRSIARTEGITPEELARIPGSGRAGRLTKDDLIAYVEKGRPGGTASGRAGVTPAVDRVPGGTATQTGMPPAGTLPAPGAPRRASAGPPVPAPVVPVGTRTTPEGQIDLVPMDHIRQKIADHMVRSKATSPHVASVAEADMTRIVRYRESVKSVFEQQQGFKLTYTPFFVLAAVRALKEFPYLNASIEGGSILIKRFINIGIAVAADYGLIVPVVRAADTLSLLGLAKAIDDLARRARAKELKPDEVTGGTFSITNMGMVGTLFGIPIIAQPQVAILGIGSIQKRPVVRDEAIAIRDMMYLSLSYDHRLIDGAMGGAFLERYAYHLEEMELPE